MRRTKAKQKAKAAIQVIIEAAKELAEAELLYLEEQETCKPAEGRRDGE